MRCSQSHKLALAALVLLPLLFCAVFFGLVSAPAARGQTMLSGDIAGTVTDPSGAAIVGAKVTATNQETGAVATVTTSTTGAYRFSLLTPGTYGLAVSAKGFKATATVVTVNIGQITTQDLKLTVGAASETIEVNATAQLLQTDTADLSTEIAYEQVQNIPNPGGDITYVAQTSPGAVMNTTGEYGNFEVYGLPGTSNNFTMNGMQVNDPFLNLNNSGPSNLLLGLNDVAEVNIVTNAYDVQYGSFGGAQVNAISRAGSNSFHGNASYWWNGRTMNANDWFLNNQSEGRPFSNTNQWAAAVGGPIKKDHTFFFVNYEGLSFITAPVDSLLLPSADYQASVIGTDSSCDDSSSSLYENGAPEECAFYKQAFGLYNGVPNHANATPLSTSNGVTPDDELELSAAPRSNLTEQLFNARVDEVVSDKDRIFVHFKYDHGVQPTYVDPFTTAFNMNSDQPDYEGQLSWTHQIAKAVNQFLITGSYYSAIFKAVDQAAATAAMPETLNFGDLDGYFSDLNYLNFAFPEGRNVSQDQFGDDFSYSFNKNTLKAGFAYKKDYVSDYDITELVTPLVLTCGSPATCNLAVGESVGNLFGSGISLEAIQDFPLATHVPISLYSLGFYVQDDWKPLSNMTVTIGARIERNSNPYAAKGSLSNFGTGFSNYVAAIGADNFESTPYSTLIKSGLNNAFPSYLPAMVEPRLGFTFSPPGMPKTVLRGGIGIFTDIFPGTIADSELFNAPVNPQFTIYFAGIDPSQSYSSAQEAATVNTTFQSDYKTGTFDSECAANANFCYSPPNFTTVASRLQYPTYEEWNLEVQHELPLKNAFDISYVGNHGYHEPVQNAALNAWGAAPFPAAPAASNPANGNSPFGSITEIRSTAVSNYNGLIVSFGHKGKSLNLQFNYAWSHGLDEISNGGILPFTTSSIENQIDPNNLRHNYGNSDYDVRHYANGNYLYDLPYFGGPKLATSGWELSGVLFLHTGFPFSVTETEFVAASGDLGGAGVAQIAPAAGTPHHCGGSAAKTSCFTDPATQFPTAGDASTMLAPYDRNQFTGPGYFDTDMTLAKTFPLYREDVKFRFGATAYNLFNHPNFAAPNSDVFSEIFGSSVSTVSPPTSIYGAFLGGDASPRIIQFTGKLTF